jgi:signal transduction histidine kinase
MIFGRNRKLLRILDTMLDDALNGRFSVNSYDESMLSKVESKMARFIERSKLHGERTEGERERVRSLISDISHQTKTPLANVALYAGLLAEQDLTAEQAALADQIKASTDKLNFLIQSLVKTSRLESGIIKIEPRPGDARALISSAIRECENLADAKGVRLSSPADGAPVAALFDPRWGAEALINIIENAVKYTPESGRVTVGVEAYEMFVRIDVEDTGRGIREDDLTKVFARFWRAAESSDSPGAGLGLYLAREIITACGGYIKAESKLGEGSKFSVFLSKP